TVPSHGQPRWKGGAPCAPDPESECIHNSCAVTMGRRKILRERSGSGNRLLRIVGNDAAVDEMDMAVHAAGQFLAMGHGHDRRALPVHEIAQYVEDLIARFR